MQFNISKEKKFFLLPASPTPNGRMHLGHISGPYLKMDVLKRKIQRGGGTALLVSGSDVYESHMESKALQLGISTDEACNKFHKLILKDFEALDIEFDFFINPLDDEFRESFATREKELLQNLVDSGKVIKKDEIFIFDSVQKKYLAGCWIKGNCPNCKATTSSYLCENCGMHYRPIDIFDQKNYPDANLYDAASLYLKLDFENLLELINKVNNGSFTELFKQYIQIQGPYIRLTTPQETGIEWPVNDSEKQVIFSYTANLLAYVFFADICKEKMKLKEHPLAKDSAYTSIVSFGVDTVLPFTAGLMGIGETLDHYKSFDYYISNYLYHLNGEKFSTSRGNVIWGNDIVSISGIQPDVVRYYLTKQNPEKETKNFDINDFIDLVNTELCGKHNKAIKEAIVSSSNSPHVLCQDLFNNLQEMLVQQNNYIEPPEFAFSKLLLPVELWVSSYLKMSKEAKKNNSYWWLKGYALLVYPVMPNISKKLWRSLCFENEINFENFFIGNQLQENIAPDVYFREISYEILEKCLPGKLQDLTN
ncbi:class I tRNA ligase family protein [Flavobacterium oreochromis]|uniref:Class I tRNA ligase family protein n=1 Tax=Flavobacterium oreochromis TaxID=2906078 RepID=A0ABW8P8S3_9FLAO|nr:class I tRNA ligase family protein [Flavobacterium oreochromis]OWP76205.1 hypothetical protein BWG23_08745 [Flavobacterium oreochromis]